MQFTFQRPEIKLKNPIKKHYLEFVTAFLTIPVLLTVFFNNVQNLRKSEAAPATSPESSSTSQPQALNIEPIIITQKETSPAATVPENQSSPLPQACEPVINHFEIVAPSENQSVTHDPVCIDVVYDQGNSCGVVWSYKINDGNFSEFDDKNICLYGLTNGQKTVTLRVKSLSGKEEKTYTRNFTVQLESQSSPPASGSASLFSST
ncbi:hypothetical protein C4579_03625 [Candidatus Microgenomates bacterium]|nr:MAG: hypothetical protein C4579_03625 [Candidatus Microgenomates bacterium]